MSLLVIAALAIAATASSSGEIRIGLIAESSRTDRFAAGAIAAAADLNAAGGVDGRYVRLIPVQATGPWQGVAPAIARLVFDHDVVALIGAADGATGHLAAQVATRARVPLVTTSLDGTLGQAHDPWIVRALPSDRAQVIALLRDVATDGSTYAVVPAGRGGRARRRAIRSGLAERDMELAAIIEVPAADAGARLEIPAGALVFVWLDPAPAVTFLEDLGASTSEMVLVGSSRLDDPDYLERAPLHADGMRLPALRPGEDSMTTIGRELVRITASSAVSDARALRDALRAAIGSASHDTPNEIEIGVVRSGRLVIDGHDRR